MCRLPSGLPIPKLMVNFPHDLASTLPSLLPDKLKTRLLKAGFPRHATWGEDWNPRPFNV